MHFWLSGCTNPVVNNFFFISRETSEKTHNSSIGFERKWSDLLSKFALGCKTFAQRLLHSGWTCALWSGRHGFEPCGLQGSSESLKILINKILLPCQIKEFSKRKTIFKLIIFIKLETAVALVRCIKPNLTTGKPYPIKAKQLCYFTFYPTRNSSVAKFI